MRRAAVIVSVLCLASAGAAAAGVALGHLTLRAGQCATLARTRVCAARAATVTVTAPPPTLTTVSFAGNGSLTLAPFTLPTGETLRWTWANTNGDFPTGMAIRDADFSTVVEADGRTVAGETFLKAGPHTLSTSTVGDWTIHIGP